jgi:AGCS family alanine or glycine:cation symporter
MDFTWFTDLVNLGNTYIWSYVLIYLLIGGGLYFTFRTRFIQIRAFGTAWRALLSSRSTNRQGITPFQAFATSLAARVGTGNLSGVASAILVGGPGAIFWMWMTAVVGMATSVIETTLAQVYKTDNDDGTYRGGPAYYIQKGLGSKALGIAFAVCLIVSFGFAFSALQANQVAAAVENAWGIPKIVTGSLLAVLIGLIIFGGIKRIAKVAELIVPIMAVSYLLVALVVVAMNLSELPSLIKLIVSHAMGLEQASAGVLGYAIKVAIEQGVKRGLFSNEAGMGSGPNAAATANPKHPVTQGLISMAGVFTDTIVICTATASIILLSGINLGDSQGLEGITLTQAALVSHIGPIGAHIIAVALILFAFTSIMANYYYGESNLRFIKENQNMVRVFRVLVLGTLILGSVVELQTIWNIADLTMGAMAIINVFALLMLSGVALKVIADFERQFKAGIDPVFDRTRLPELDNKADSEAWAHRKADY